MKRKAIASVLLIIALITGLCACGKADISAYENAEITVVGLTDEPFTITPKELAEMECESATAEGETEKAGTVDAYGPTLETFLKHYDKTPGDFYAVRFTAKDGYSVKIGKNTWDKYPVYLSISGGKEPLLEKQQPLRIVIPGGSSGNWIYSVTSIEFITEES